MSDVATFHDQLATGEWKRGGAMEFLELDIDPAYEDQLPEGVTVASKGPSVNRNVEAPEGTEHYRFQRKVPGWSQGPPPVPTMPPP